jgi:hypothetical protein
MKSVAQLIKELQTVFNEYIRERDKGSPCISCRASYFSDCGHLFKISIRPAMRFNPGAAHGQCRECNSMHDGNYENFCKGIAARYVVEFLTDIIQEANNSRKNIHKWSRTEIEDLILFYKNEIKKLKT